MKTRVLILMALAITLIATAASANGRVDRREVRQHDRIHNGVQNDQLTRYEARRLRAGQRHVHRMESRAWRNGDLSRREALRLEHAQDVQSRRIWRLKHNERSR